MKILIPLVCLTSLPALAQEAAIKICFHNQVATVTGMTGRPAGDIVNTAEETWNNVLNQGGGGLTQNNIALDLVDGEGSGATLSVVGNDARNSGSAWDQNSQDWVMMESTWTMNNSSSITISNIPASLATAGYYLTIFGDTGDNRVMNFYRDGETAPLVTLNDVAGAFNGTFTQDSNVASSVLIHDTSLTIKVDTATNTGGRLSFVQAIILGPKPTLPHPPGPETVAQSGGFWDALTWNDGTTNTVGNLDANDDAAISSYREVQYRGVPATETVASLTLGNGSGSLAGQGTLRVTSGALNVAGDLVVGTNSSPNDSFLHVIGGSMHIGGNARFGRDVAYTDGSLIIDEGEFSVAGNLEMGGYNLGGAMMRFHNVGGSPAVSVDGLLDLGRCSLDLTFDADYTHVAGTTTTLVTYGSRKGQFRNFRHGDEFNCGPNRFRIDYDVTTPNAITLTALPNWPTPANRPNIVLILADDQGYADTSLNGGTKFPMPNLDTLASAGAKFTNAYVTGGVCHPTRCGILTGRYQERVGSENNLGGPSNSGMAVSERTIARRLQGLGYYTAAVGKWHLGYDIDFHPNNRGFDRWYGMRAGSRTYYDSLAENNVFDDQTTPDIAGEIADPDDYLTDRIGDKVVEIIDDHLNSGRAADPFFIYMAFTDVHSPIQIKSADNRFARLQNEFGLTANSYLNSPYRFAPDGGDGLQSPAEQAVATQIQSQAQVDSKRYQLAAQTLALDENVGKVLQKLDAEGIADNTIVLYINDNGGAGYTNQYGGNYSYNAPLIGYKGGEMYEGAIRVPCAIRWPGVVPAGQVIDTPVISIDFGATFINAGEGVPVQARNGLDGLDLKPLLKDGIPLPADRMLTWRIGGRNAQGSAARMGDWKLRFDEFLDPNAPPKLFNLASDPVEQTDLATSQPEIYHQMLQRFNAWESRTIAPLYGGPSTASTDSGLERWPFSGGLLLESASATPQFFSSQIRYPDSLDHDFSYTILVKASEPGPYGAGAGLWGALSDSSNRSRFIRFGIDFADSKLRLVTPGGATSVDLNSLPLDEFASVTLSYDSALEQVTLSGSGTDARATIPLPASEYGALKYAGMGASNMSGEVTSPRRGGSVNDARTTLTRIEDGSPVELRLELAAEGPFEPTLEQSADLDGFSPEAEVLTESLGGGVYRVSVPTADPLPPRQFYRFRSDRRR